MFSSKSITLFKSICGTTRVNNTLRLSSHFTYQPDTKPPVDGTTTKMNMFQAINNALDIALKEDESAVIFGEDVGFGGVFRCSLNLQVIFNSRNEPQNKNLSHVNSNIVYFQCYRVEKVRCRSCV